jgi:hypothetical protein
MALVAIKTTPLQKTKLQCCIWIQNRITNATHKANNDQDIGTDNITQKWLDIGNVAKRQLDPSRWHGLKRISGFCGLPYFKVDLQYTTYTSNYMVN